MPDEAIHDKYLIVPDGSPDGWNPQVKMQRDIGFMQTFAPLPNSNSDFWVERAMRSCVGGQARQGFKGVNMKAADEYEAQANEILLLTAMPPFPVQPQPQQDQPTRIKCLIDWLHAAQTLNIPVEPMARMLVQKNLAMRLEILQKQNPSAAAQIKKMLMQMEQASAQPQGQPQQPQIQAP